MKKFITVALMSLFTISQAVAAENKGVAPAPAPVEVAPAPAPAKIAPVAVAPAPAPTPAPAPVAAVPAPTPPAPTSVSSVPAPAIAVPAQAAKPLAKEVIKYKMAVKPKPVESKPVVEEVTNKNSQNKTYDKQTTKLFFSEVAKIEVEPDYHNAILHFEISGEGEFSVMQNQLNDSMQKALAIAKEYPGFRIETKDYNVVRNYSDGVDKDLRWTASQKIVIDTKNKTQLINAVARIQGEGFALDKLTSYLSDEKKAEYKNKLIEDALSLIKARANVVASSLGKRAVKFSELRIEGDNFYQFSYDLKSSMAKSAMVANPVLESPSKTISLTLSVEVLLM